MFSSRKKIIRGRNSGRATSSFRASILRGVISIVSTVLVLVLVYYVTRLDMFTLKSVVVEGGETIPHGIIKDQAEALLSGSYMSLVPKRFVYAYPEEIIRDAIMRIPRVKAVSLMTTDDRYIKIAFEEHIPHALWCLKDLKDTPCYFLSSEGFGFAEAPVLHGGAFVRHYTESDSELKQRQVLEAAILKDIDWFSEQLEREFGFRTVSIVWKNNNDVELYVSGGGMLIMALGKDIRTTYDNLKAVLASKEYEHIEPGNFKYIDIRFDKKIFVNEVLVSEEATTTVETTGEKIVEN